jgi:hypothetical protein
VFDVKTVEKIDGTARAYQGIGIAFVALELFYSPQKAKPVARAIKFSLDIVELSTN